MPKHKFVTDPPQTTHVQVPFVTRQGISTKVDQDLFWTLTILKYLGVETQFSCQGDYFGAYICTYTHTMRPVIRKALRLYKDGNLCADARVVMDQFIFVGEREACVSRDQDKTKWRSGDLDPQYFSYERKKYSWYGDRTTIRWPKAWSRQMSALLMDVYLAS